MKVYHLQQRGSSTFKSPDALASSDLIQYAISNHEKRLKLMVGQDAGVESGATIKNKIDLVCKIKPIIHDNIHSCFWLIFRGHDLQLTRHGAPDPMNFTNKKYIKVLNVFDSGSCQVSTSSQFRSPNFEHFVKVSRVSQPTTGRKLCKFEPRPHTLPEYRKEVVIVRAALHYGQGSWVMTDIVRALETHPRAIPWKDWTLVTCLHTRPDS